MWIECWDCRHLESGDCEGTDHDKYAGCLNRINSMCIRCKLRADKECSGTMNKTYSGCIYRKEVRA